MSRSGVFYSNPTTDAPVFLQPLFSGLTACGKARLILSRKQVFMKKVLLTTVCGPFGVNTHDCTEHIQTELFHAQVTRAQGIFSPRVTYISYGLEYIAENLQAPVTVLQYPTMRQFRRELKKGYDYVGINFVIATFEKRNFACKRNSAGRVRHHAAGMRALRRPYLPRGGRCIFPPASGRIT